MFKNFKSATVVDLNKCLKQIKLPSISELPSNICTMDLQECSTVSEEKCETEYMTKYEEECTTVTSQQCSTVNEQQCTTVTEQESRVASTKIIISSAKRS